VFKRLSVGGLSAVLAVGAVVGLAAASIPNENKVFFACMKTSTGTLRMIDHPTKKCVRGERRISWNQRGQVGPTGPEGAAGARGPEGPAGDGVEALSDLEGMPCNVPGISDHAGPGTTDVKVGGWNKGSRVADISIRCLLPYGVLLEMNSSDDVEASGSVTSDPPGLTCGNMTPGGVKECWGAFPEGTEVTLIADPAPGSYTAVWLEECSNDRTNRCTFTVTGTQWVRVYFDEQ
jgi:hypothetical protein